MFALNLIVTSDGWRKRTRLGTTRVLSTGTCHQTLASNMAPPKHNAVLPHALRVPGLTKLYGKRVILASNSPRRKEILKTFVSGAELNWLLCVVVNIVD